MNLNNSNSDRIDIAFKELMINLFGDYPTQKKFRQVTETQYCQCKKEIELKYQITQNDDDF